MKLKYQNHHSFFIILIFSLTIMFVAPVLLNAGPPAQKAKTDCTYSVEKSKDGKAQYKLEGKGCEKFVANMEPEIKTKAMGVGNNCEGGCHCTWYDECGKNGCFVCRGCCREVLTLSRH